MISTFLLQSSIYWTEKKIKQFYVSLAFKRWHCLKVFIPFSIFIFIFAPLKHSLLFCSVRYKLNSFMRENIMCFLLYGIYIRILFSHTEISENLLTYAKMQGIKSETWNLDLFYNMCRLGMYTVNSYLCIINSKWTFMCKIW